MRFTDSLKQAAAPVWEAELRHPFVRGIVEGTLPIEKFKFYLCQDYLFLIEYCRLFALCCAKAPDLDLMEKFAELLEGTLTREMALHRSYPAEFDLSEAEMARADLHETTRAYTRHLLSIAWSGPLVEIAAALLPCMWGYWEIGTSLAEELAAQGATEPAAEPRYGAWIKTYSDPTFGELAEWCRSLLDDRFAAASLPTVQQARLTDHFLTSCRYELQFWDMGWQGAVVAPVTKHVSKQDSKQVSGDQSIINEQ